jgi:hypothetical protein
MGNEEWGMRNGVFVLLKIFCREGVSDLSAEKGYHIYWQAL